MAHNTYFSKQLQHQKACDGQQALRQMAHFYPEISAVQLYASTPLTRGGSRSAGWIFDGFRMLPSPARCVEVSHGCNKNNNIPKIWSRFANVCNLKCGFYLLEFERGKRFLSFQRHDGALER